MRWLCIGIYRLVILCGGERYGGKHKGQQCMARRKLLEPGTKRLKQPGRQQHSPTDDNGTLAAVDAALARMAEREGQTDISLSATALLRSIAENPEANVMARTSAARALAEIEGAL